MKSKNHIIIDILEKYTGSFSNQYDSIEKELSIEHLVAEVFTLGPFYHYVIHMSDSTLSNCSSELLTIHGLQEYPGHLKDIIDLIHPDDLAFVLEAEAWTLEKYKEIGFEHQLQLKSGYCFRMKVKAGSYELFYHQTIHIAKDEKGWLLQTINIHTNIQHITQQNNYIVTVAGMGGRSDSHQKVIYPENNDNTSGKRLTKRELEILNLLIKGYTDKEISDIMNISFHTVRTHHRNILSKTKSKNSKYLIKRSLENGYL